MSKRRKASPEADLVIEEIDGKAVLFIRVDGVKIAKRGHPDTPHAKTWIPLEPGWTVRDVDPNGLEISYNDVSAH